MPDTMKVVIDYNYAKKSEKPNIDTGLFTLIYQGEFINSSYKKSTLGPNGTKVNLLLEGKKWTMGKKKRKRKK